ncbi:hypothetical protein M0657_010008 [Pyricularia oryzae]|uniref:Uncharacterized protein n=3 Tax=Pyricularia oryzae TaxID=318829 RepID=A0A4P7N8Y3_PYROR|nr:hypothetical protein OOU_Y34scaffold00187g8 [Pyricularia oryzae Y34]KAI7913487.1 hypothetical protein M0657_010008 [Pyricularia oryzae]QBZ58152.1 hypothetical protein PoMZ_03093 [Pyricularia oryzae]
MKRISGFSSLERREKWRSGWTELAEKGREHKQKTNASRSDGKISRGARVKDAWSISGAWLKSAVGWR